jgi:S-adenosylmethionine hydrolase
MSTIALITDLGSDNWFAGELKGAILSLNAQAVPVDLTHSVPMGGVREGAFALMAGYRSFPEDTIFLSAVDYGSAKTRVIAAKTASYIFAAPDNGLLSWALRREPSAEIREVNTDEYLLPSGCETFPARDLLAPLCASLSDWLDFSDCGEITPNYVKLEWPKTQAKKGEISGSIVHIDKFGNAVTSITPRELSDACEKRAVCVINNDKIPTGSGYNDVQTGKAIAYPGSAGLMEIGVNSGNAAEALGINIGSPVIFKAR